MVPEKIFTIKFLKCIDNRKFQRVLTIGRYYIIFIKDNNYCTSLSNDGILDSGLSKKRFEE